MRYQHLIYLMISLLLGLPSVRSYAQEEEMPFHALEPEDDVFQDAFFAALRYKAIGNYKLALQALDKAEREAGTQKEKLEAIRFERAQNYYYLEDYQESIAGLEGLSNADLKRETLVWLYKNYMEIRAYKEAKEVVVQLLGYSEIYLPNFYMLYVDLTNDSEQALEILEQVLKNRSNTRQVGFYKSLIQASLLENKKETKQSITKASDKEMQQLQAYLQKEDGEEAGMYMELLLQENSNTVPVLQQLEALGDSQKAYRILAAIFMGNLPDKNKQYVLSTLLQQQNKAGFTHFIEQVYTKLDAKSLQILGDYFQEKQDSKEAKRMYLKSLAISFDNYSLIVETLELLSETEDYNEQLELVENAMDYYPMQPILYLHKGEALSAMQQWKEAKEVLEEGASYVIDQPDLQQEFAEKLLEVNKHLN